MFTVQGSGFRVSVLGFGFRLLGAGLAPLEGLKAFEEFQMAVIKCSAPALLPAPHPRLALGLQSDIGPDFRVLGLGFQVTSFG